jgi:hypothetical protein
MRAVDALREHTPEEHMDYVNEMVGQAMDEDNPEAVVQMAELLLDEDEFDADATPGEDAAESGEGDSPRDTGTEPYDLSEYDEGESPYTEGEGLPESVTDSYVGEDIDTDIPSVDTMSNMNGRQLADMADYFDADVSDEDIQEAMSLDGELDSEDIATQIASTAELGNEPVITPEAALAVDDPDPDEARERVSEVEDQVVDPDAIGDEVFTESNPENMDNDDLEQAFMNQYVEAFQEAIEEAGGNWEAFEDAVDELAGERAEMYAPSLRDYDEPSGVGLSASEDVIDEGIERAFND